MLESSLSKTQIKGLMKAAILEISQERQDLFQDLIAEALEDIALVKAIDEGKDSAAINREAIFEILKSGDKS